MLGSGEAGSSGLSRAAAQANPAAIGASIGYDEPLSHLIQAGADAILMPSRFEPCGLTQLYGLRYGTLPVVAASAGSPTRWSTPTRPRSPTASRPASSSRR